MSRHIGIACLIAMAALIAGAESSALAQVHAWSHNFGGTGDDFVRGVAVDGDGNVLIVGSCSSITDFGGGDIVTQNNSRDIFVAKFTAGGFHLWSQAFPHSSGNDEGYGIATDASGNVFITGNFFNTVDFGGGDLTSAGGADIFLAKYDAGGTYQWGKRFGTTAHETGYAVAADASGNVVFTGQFQGTVDFGGGPLVASGAGTDIFVAKYDATGAHVWSKHFGDTQSDEGYGIDVDGSGNVVVTGQFKGTVDFGGGPLTSPPVNLSIFLAKYDASGTHQWSKHFVGLGSEIGRAVAIDAAGSIVVTGQYAGNVDFGGGPLNWVASGDCFVAKFDANGVHQWSHGFGGSSQDPAYGVAVDAAGNVAITGYFIGTANFGGDDLTSNAGSNDIFFARYSASGVHQWSQRFGNSSPDYGWAVAMNGAGDAFLAGEFNGPVDFGGGPLDNEFEISQDIILARFGNAVTGVETSASHSVSIAAYPNPFNPATTIRYTVTEPGRVRLRIYDASGKHVVTLLNEEQSPGSHTVRWGGRDEKGVSVSSGVYFLSLEQDGVLQTTKVTLLK